MDNVLEPSGAERTPSVSYDPCVDAGTRPVSVDVIIGPHSVSRFVDGVRDLKP